MKNVIAKIQILRMVSSIGPSPAIRLWLIIDTEPEASQKEVYASWALFILIMLLIFALFASYMLQHKKIQAIHETVLSIFAGELLSVSCGLDSADRGRNGRRSNHQIDGGHIHPEHRQL